MDSGHPPTPRTIMSYFGRSQETLKKRKIRSYLYLDYILVGEGFVWLVVLCVLEKDLVHVGAGVLVELVAAAEDDQGYFTVAEYRELVSLFHHPELSLVESHLEREMMLLSCW